MIELLIAALIFVPGIIVHSYRDHARDKQLAEMCGADRIPHPLGDNQLSADEQIRRTILGIHGIK